MYPVVYSYKRSRTRELELSLESLRNLKEWDGRVFIVGDNPSFEGNYNHLPIKYKWGKQSGIKSNDEICAYLTASDILDEFIIMADDIFVLKPYELVYQNRGMLENHIEARHRGDSYGRLLKNTDEFLKENEMTSLSYEMHIPFLVDSEQVKDAAEIIKLKKPMLIRSIIGNWYSLVSQEAEDPKNKPITDETIIYSSQDSTFNYDEVRKHIQ